MSEAGAKVEWLTEMKVENHIELITRPMLETMAEETQYLAVFFCKYPNMLELVDESQKYVFIGSD